MRKKHYIVEMTKEILTILSKMTKDTFHFRDMKELKITDDIYVRYLDVQGNIYFREYCFSDYFMSGGYEDKVSNIKEYLVYNPNYFYLDKKIVKEIYKELRKEYRISRKYWIKRRF